MYEAKLRGKNAVDVFRPELLAAVKSRLELGTNLRSAVERGEIEVHYQPTFDVATGGASASRRSRAGGVTRRRRSIRSTSSRSPRRRARSCSSAGTSCVPRCTRAVAWQREYGVDIDIAVNVSKRQLVEPDFVEEVRALLTESGLPAGVAAAGGHREPAAHRRPGRRDRAAPAEGPRPPARDRRLRHRLLVAELPHAAAGRRGEARPVVHRGHRHRHSAGAAVPHRRRARTGPRPDRDRRGRRAARAALPAARLGLPGGAGLLLRPARSGVAGRAVARRRPLGRRPPCRDRGVRARGPARLEGELIVSAQPPTASRRRDSSGRG